jgi:ribosomal protein L3 glutamine methyltransferase
VKLDTYIDDVAARFAAADLSYGHGTDNPFDEAVYLIYCLLGIDFESSISSVNRAITEEEWKRLEAAVERRIEQRYPVAYLVNEAWFAGHRFRCDERALVPRSPIAELINGQFQPILARPPARILDLCCGGGCIGIACALEFPQSRVTLADISAESLALAEENIELHQLQDRVSSVQSNLFENLMGSYDLIVTNPPYVSSEELAELPLEYTHEPVLGLISPQQGLLLPLQILRDAAAHLSADGLLVMEVGYSAQRLQQRLADVPLLWLEFEQGGEGVFALTAGELRQYSSRFN